MPRRGVERDYLLFGLTEDFLYSHPRLHESDLVSFYGLAKEHGITMKVDNTVWEPVESDGSAIRPLTYKGRTYLPLRALAEKLGVAVDWDSVSETIFIGEKDWSPLQIDLIDSKSLLSGDYNTVAFSVDKEQLFQNGKSFDSGVIISGRYAGKTGPVINTAGKYQTIKGTMTYAGTSKYDAVDITMKDYSDSTVFKQFSLEKGQVVDFEVDIRGVSKLKIVADLSGRGGDKVVIGDVQLK